MKPASLALVLVSSLLAGACQSSAGAAGKPAAAPPPGSSAVVAEVAGAAITLEEVDKKAGVRLQEVRDQEYEARRAALDELIADHLSRKEAAARGVSVEQLLRQEVEAGVAAPSPAEVAAIYEANKARLGGRTLQDLAPQIESQMRAQRAAERRRAFAQQLRAKAELKVRLPQPRLDVPVPADAPALGPEGAPVTIVEYLDYQCPFCHRAQGVVDELLKLYAGKMRFVHRDYPLDFHAEAVPAARAARCAGEQGRFWEYHRHLLVTPGSFQADDLRQRAHTLGLDDARFSACLASTKYTEEVQRAYEEGQALGVTGTPTFFINGRRLSGVRPLEQFREIIDEELGS
jgi:protein-disulfide isomerase